jgi:hypothetical protein
MVKRKTLGIIQSRGLGDLIIALPIAGHYYEQGYDVIWPILDQFVPSMTAAAPWVKWVPVPYDAPGRYFYDIPQERLRNFKCDEILCLYQHLSGHKFNEEKYFQYTSFDQYKYIAAGVPFLKKWDLAQYITRNPAREQALYNLVVTNPEYVVTHLQGSDHRASYDPAIVPAGWQTVEITERPGYTLLDWLLVLERAQSLILVDSVYANLVDQLNVGEDRYFIQRSHMGLTPVQGQHWTWL